MPHSSQVWFSLRSLVTPAPVPFERHAPYDPETAQDYGFPKQTLRLNDEEICFIDAGRAGGEPLLFLHGMGANIRRWHPTLQHLAGRYRVIALDFPGCGASGKSHPARYGPHYYRDLVLAFAAARRLPPLTLIGHSMGGGVTLELLLQKKLAVKRAVVVSPAGAHARHSLPSRILASIFLRLTPRAILYRHLLNHTVCRSTPAVQEMLRHINRIDRDPVWPELRKTLMYLSRRLLAWDLRPRLHEIRAPLLIVWGEEDRLQKPGLALEMHRHIPSARVALLPGVAHYPQLEAPETFNALLDDFLADREFVVGCESC